MKLYDPDPRVKRALKIALQLKAISPSLAPELEGHIDELVSVLQEPATRFVEQREIKTNQPGTKPAGW